MIDEVVFRKNGARYEAVMPDRLFWRPNLGRLMTEHGIHGEPPPTELPRGRAVRVELKDEAERAQIIGQLRPGLGTKGALAAALEGVSDLTQFYASSRWERYERFPPVDCGNSIDGERWGWIPISAGVSIGRGAGEVRRWAAAPLDFADARSVGETSVWFTGSMTGIVMTGEASYGGGLAVAHVSDDENGLRWVEVSPNFDSAGDAYVFLAESTLEDGPTCPRCEQDEFGWEVSLSPSEDVPDWAIENALDVLISICDRHLTAEITVSVGDGEWMWGGAAWRPRDT